MTITPESVPFDLAAKFERDLTEAARLAGFDMTLFHAKVTVSNQPGVDYQSASVIRYCQDVSRIKPTP